MIVLKGTREEVESQSGFGTHPEETTLKQHLDDLHVNTIYCVGLAQDCCVGATALDGAKYGFRTFVITDATKPVSDEGNILMSEKLTKHGVR